MWWMPCSTRQNTLINERHMNKYVSRLSFLEYATICVECVDVVCTYMEFGGWSIAVPGLRHKCVCVQHNFFPSSSSSSATSLLFGQRHITVSMNAVNVNRACIQFHKYNAHGSFVISYTISNSNSWWWLWWLLLKFSSKRVATTMKFINQSILNEIPSFFSVIWLNSWKWKCKQ